MRDPEYLKLLKLTVKEVVKRYKNKPCKIIAVGCKNCETQILLGYLESEIDLINWVLKK